jgi:hypothetical protein
MAAVRRSMPKQARAIYTFTENRNAEWRSFGVQIILRESDLHGVSHRYIKNIFPLTSLNPKSIEVC